MTVLRPGVLGPWEEDLPARVGLAVTPASVLGCVLGHTHQSQTCGLPAGGRVRPGGLFNRTPERLLGHELTGAVRRPWTARCPAWPGGGPAK